MITKSVLSCILLVNLSSVILTLKISGDACQSRIPGETIEIDGVCTHASNCTHATLKTPYCRIKHKLICCPSKLRKSEIYCLKENVIVPYNLNKIQIVGGERAKQEDYPHMVSLGRLNNGKYKHVCGGSLISSNFVLTAAHCFVNYGNEEEKLSQIRLGVVNLDGPDAVNVNISNVTLYPEYHLNSSYHDIALIQLEKSMNFSLNIRPACLWQNVNDLDGLPAKVVGFGLTEDFNDDSASKYLMEANLEIWNRKKCNKLYKKTKKLNDGITDKLICAGDFEKGSDSCSGDSGGPIHVDNPRSRKTSAKYVIGLVAFGKKCGDKNIPGVYTKVYPYLDWIESIVWKDDLS